MPTVTGRDHRLSYYREMRGSVLLTIGECITAYLDHVIELPFMDTIGMNEKCRKLNSTCRKKSVTSLIKQHCKL